MPALLSLMPATLGWSIETTLQEVADVMSKQYNLSFSLSYHDANQTVSAASGFTDAGLGMGSPSQKATVSDKYVWGSTTKMFTAAAVLQLVDRGVVALDDPAAKHIDPILQRLNGTTLADHFGEAVGALEVRHLLHMTSGLSDYDGAAYTTAQFQRRAHDFSPLEILSGFVPPLSRWARPGTRQRYCSTNYILLGLLLARHLAPATGGWAAYAQASVFPPTLRPHLAATSFALRGACAAHTRVHGFMEGYPELKSLPPQDVWNVSCLGGWTAGNLVAPVSALALFTRELYRPGGSLISAARQSEMIDFSDEERSPALRISSSARPDWTPDHGLAKKEGRVGSDDAFFRLNSVILW